MNKRELLKALLEGKINVTMRTFEEALGTEDFTNVLVDAAHVAAMKGFQSQPALWELISSTVPRNDFKVNNIVSTEGLGRLEKKMEREPYYEVTLSDKKGYYSLARWGKIFGISMEAYVNDVTGEIVKKFTRWGAVAQDTLNYWRFYTMLDANPTLTSDSIQLFHADHNNKLGTSKALSQSTLAEAIAKMQSQTDSAGEKLNIMPKYLVVHPNQADVAYRLTQSKSFVAQGVGSSADLTGANNWWYGMLKVIVAPWITSGRWYLIADPTLYPVCEMGFYQGRKEPEILIQPNNSDAEFFRDTRYSKIRLIFGGEIEDYRTYVGANF